MEKSKLGRTVLLIALVLVVGLGLAGVSYAAQRSDQAAQTATAGDEGVLVASVTPESPAGEAGLERGDILLSIDGQAVNSASEVRAVLSEKAAGDEVALTVLHGDEERTLHATLDSNLQLGFSSCGCEFGNGRTIEREEWIVDGGSARVVAVEEGSPAEAAGVQTGDVIVALNGDELTTESGLADRLAESQPGDAVSLDVERDGETLTLEATLAEHPEQKGVGYLGVSIASGPTVFSYSGRAGEAMPDWMPEITEMGQAGAVVLEVQADSPAEAAGLQADDLIVAVDDELLDEMGDLAGRIAEYVPGDRITLSLERDGEVMDLSVTLAQAPDDPQRAYLGITYRPSMTVSGQSIVIPDLDEMSGMRGWLGEDGELPWLNEFDNLTDVEGILVASVEADSPAEAAGLQPGDIISAVDGEPVTSTADLNLDDHRPGDELTLTVVTPGQESREVVVSLAEAPDDAGRAWLGIGTGPTFRFHRQWDGEDLGEELDLFPHHWFDDDDLVSPPLELRGAPSVPESTL